MSYSDSSFYFHFSDQDSTDKAGKILKEKFKKAEFPLRDVVKCLTCGASELKHEGRFFASYEFSESMDEITKALVIGFDGKEDFTGNGFYADDFGCEIRFQAKYKNNLLSIQGSEVPTVEDDEYEESEYDDYSDFKVSRCEEWQYNYEYKDGKLIEK